ncbi:hypothetical protein ASF23_02240 [Curtobacterium sp. Leaf261]|nr:hypothetical protein ASF23_02240 [Curtobacterium sp. Leaf261]
MPLEDLSRVAAEQRYLSGGIRVSYEAWTALWKARGGGRFLRIREGAPTYAELHGLDLITEKGVPTDLAHGYLDVRERATISMGAEGRSGGRRSTWSGWFGPDGVVVVAGPQLTTNELPTDDRLTLVLVQETFALGLLLSWMGIGPTWAATDEGGPADYDRAEVDARVAAVGDVPPIPDHAGWAVERAWPEGRWTRFELAVPRTRMGQQFVRAGDLDWFRPVDRPGGRVQLEMFATNDVMREVLAVFRQSIDQLVRR